MELIHKEEAYKIIGVCMEVHRTLGKGFLEIGRYGLRFKLAGELFFKIRTDQKIIYAVEIYHLARF